MSWEGGDGSFPKSKMPHLLSSNQLAPRDLQEELQVDGIKVFITSCETVEGAWRHHERQLKRFYELSNKKYSMVDNPESADIILIGNVREENWGSKIFANWTSPLFFPPS